MAHVVRYMEVLLHPAIQQCLSTVDAAGRAVIVTDPHGRVMFWNETAEQIYGWTAQEAAGRDILELTPGDFARTEAAEIMAALQRGEPWSGEFVVRAKDGTRFTVHVVDVPVAAEDGTLVGVVGISRRVSYTRQ